MNYFMNVLIVDSQYWIVYELLFVEIKVIFGLLN